MAELVWYASYGSNMSAERFACYLGGGTPTGSSRRHEGCRSAATAVGDRAIVLPGTVFFSGTSKAWTGGHAYLDASDARPTASALGRAWLITSQQFDDVVAQENSRPVGSVELDAATMRTGEQRLVAGSRYPVAWCVDALDGVPVVTFTCAEAMGERELNAPSLPYLRTLALGLVESGHAAGPAEAATYLVSLPGAAGHWSAPGLGATLQDP